MEDIDKTKEQLVKELAELRKRNAELVVLETERKKAEETLRRSEKKHRTLFETMVQDVVYQDAEGNIISANPDAERILGLTLDQMQGKTSMDPRWKSIHEDGSDLPGETHPSMVALKTGKEVHNVVIGVFNPKDEEYHWININAVPQFLPGEKKPYQVYTTFHDITERKKAEEELKKNEALLNEAEIIGDFGCWKWDLENDKMEWSDNLFRLLGLKPTKIEEIDYTKAKKYTHPDDKEMLEMAIRESIKTKQPWYIDNRIIREDGKVRWVISRGKAIYDEKGKAVWMTGSMYDITERKKEEETLQSKKDELQLILDSSPVMIFYKDREGRFILANEALAQALGKPKEEIDGRLLSELLPKDQAEQMDADDREVMESEKPKIGIIEAYESPEGTRWSRTSKVPLKDYKGDIIGIVGFGEDVTEWKKADKELRQKTAEQEVLLSSIPSFVYYKDTESRLIAANRAFAEMVNTPVDQLTGKTAYDLFPKEQAEAFHKDDIRVMESGKPVMNIEESFTDAEGRTKWASTSKIPYFDENGKVVGMVGITWDITMRKKAEEQVKASLREKEVLLNEIHHRVKNNLAVISSLLSYQVDRIQDKQYLNIFNESIKRINVMAQIHEILYKSGNLAQIDFEEYINKISENIISLYMSGRGNISIKTDIEDVHLDLDNAIPCGLIINELLSNSYKHAFPNNREGEITISLREQDDKTIYLMISDNGIGIPEELDWKSTESLGLRIVNLLVHQLEGEIGLTLAEGTEFRITFPKGD